MISGPASAASITVYDNIPSPQPGNLPSMAFEATSTSEFGGQIQLASGTTRDGLTLTALMSSWGCEDGAAGSSGTCRTTPGSTFPVDITANVYRVGTDGAVGDLITTATKSFAIAYRPSASSTCGNGGWGAECSNGLATPITFDRFSVALPDAVIVTLAYNTTHYGYAPVGDGAACYTESGGCGYDSLNVAVTSPPTVGSDPRPDDAYLSSSWGDAYCDGGTAGTGELRLDSGCWTGYQPAFRLTGENPRPSTTDSCKNGGWMTYTNPSYRNQGECISSMQKGKQA